MYQKCVLALVCILLCSGGAWAQETTTGSIAGTVVDGQGLGVPGATVTIITPQRERSFVTNDNGGFFAPFLTPGLYEVRVELDGFKTLDRQNIEIRLGQRVNLNLPLQVGPLTESVTVSGAPPLIVHDHGRGARKRRPAEDSGRRRSTFVSGVAASRRPSRAHDRLLCLRSAAPRWREPGSGAATRTTQKARRHRARVRTAPVRGTSRERQPGDQGDPIARPRGSDRKAAELAATPPASATARG